MDQVGSLRGAKFDVEISAARIYLVSVWGELPLLVLSENMRFTARDVILNLSSIIWRQARDGIEMSSNETSLVSALKTLSPKKQVAFALLIFERMQPRMTALNSLCGLTDELNSDAIESLKRRAEINAPLLPLGL